MFAGLTTDLVRRSDNAGITWIDLSAGPTQVADLLLTSGGQALLAATSTGVWRIEV